MPLPSETDQIHVASCMVILRRRLAMSLRPLPVLRITASDRPPHSRSSSHARITPAQAAAAAGSSREHRHLAGLKVGAAHACIRLARRGTEADFGETQIRGVQPLAAISPISISTARVAAQSLRVTQSRKLAAVCGAPKIVPRETSIPHPSNAAKNLSASTLSGSVIR
jgi:hypothetical protein